MVVIALSIGEITTIRALEIRDAVHKRRARSEP
jgi:hypothetical protein